MTTHLRFLHVCERQFAGLPGEDPQRRTCDTCSTVVHNLDALSPEARADLLTNARAEQTTVCVSLSLPPDAAQACRSGAAVGVTSPPTVAAPDYLPTAGIAMPAYFQPLRPQRDDPCARWQTFAADLPAVLAALAAIAPGFTLTHDGDDAWQFHDTSMDLGVMIVAESAGKETAVGVQIAPPGGVSQRSVLATYGGLAVLVLVPMWVILVFALWLAGFPGLVVGLGATAVAGLLVVVMAGFLAVNALGERVQRRAQDRWKAAWHRRFWPALTAQLSEAQPYR